MQHNTVRWHAENTQRLHFDAEAFPALRKASGHVTSGTFDERFEFALDMQVTALRAELARTGS